MVKFLLGMGTAFLIDAIYGFCVVYLKFGVGMMEVPKGFKIGKTLTSKGIMCYWFTFNGKQYIVSKLCKNRVK